MDRHRFFVTIEGDYSPTLRVECPYEGTDVARPCWPHTEGGEPEPSPQEMCTYESWIENLGPGELLHGSQEFQLRAVARWEGGNFELYLAPPPDSFDVCGACGHVRHAHIYEQGACRPGFECFCPEFESVRTDA